MKTKRKISVLVVAPTRELAIQIKDSFNIYGKYTGLRNTVVYGGVGQNPQVKKLQQGVDILVATPGRLLDLIRQGHINLGYVEVLILDEGDRMLDMGFIKDIRTIINYIPKKNRQTLLFSATIPPEVKKLANSILNTPIRIDISPEQPTLESLKQSVFLISKNKKQALLEKLLFDKSIKRALVFMRTKHGANRVVKILKRKGIRTDAIHGNKSQTARQNALQSFRTGAIRVLVATDVASRGIDVDEISHVIQFDLPNEAETYLHRIGRTARAGAGGIAYAFCEENERPKLKEIEKLIRMRLNIVKNHI
jgi:ATP-dependent RNA helicase RhlE